MFKDKTVVITGASSGIGRAMAIAFAKQGAFVGMVARRLDRLKDMEAEITAAGGNAWAIQADVTDLEALRKGLHDLVERTGRLDVLVNNAAIGIFGREPSEQEYLNIYDVNVHSVYRLSKMAVPYLQMTSGTILNIGSTVTERPFAGELVYTATKGAVTALTKAMAAAYGKQGIRVNMLQPGVIESEFNVKAGLPPEIDRMAYVGSEQLNALATTGVASDAANAALFLCSDQARFITGEVLKVDGGITLAPIRS